MKFRILLPIVTMVILAGNVRGFNIDTEIKDNKYPRIIKQKEGGLFGHTMSLENHNKRLIISAPKSSFNETSGEIDSGSVYSCQNLLNGQASCTESSPNNAPDFAESLESLSPSQAVGCAYSTEQNCGFVKFLPGFCYRGNHSSSSPSWMREERIKPAKDCKLRTIDIMIVLDGSGSVGKYNFVIMKDWVTSLVSGFPLRHGLVRIGVIQFSENTKSKMVTEIPIKDATTFSQFKDDVRDIRYQKGYFTFTSEALSKAAYELNKVEKKTTMRKVIILVTDGKATTSSRKRLPTVSRNVRDRGIETYAVGIKSADKKELRIIATGNLTSDKQVFFLDDFAGLNLISKELTDQILTTSLEGSTSRFSKYNYGMQNSQTGFSIRSAKSSYKYNDYTIHSRGLTTTRLGGVDKQLIDHGVKKFHMYKTGSSPKLRSLRRQSFEAKLIRLRFLRWKLGSSRHNYKGEVWFLCSNL